LPSQQTSFFGLKQSLVPQLRSLGPHVARQPAEGFVPFGA
jgi:hypothetical protein